MMKEITRIHLAKSSYDIELAAKKQLEKYIASLETYAQDADVMQDIEIRMTELLDERGVKTNGVITLDDVKAICQQLGEPHEFASEEADMALGSIKASPTGKRTLYRDGNAAVLGGVLSGLAAYTGINAIWLRITFLIVTFVSFGTALLIYVVMWFIVPKARTAAEKLAMNGEPATLESIKRLNASEELAAPNNTSRFVIRAIQILAGVGASIGACLAVVAIIGAVYFVFFSNVPFGPITDSALFWVTLVLAVIAGLLLATLFFLIAYAAFASKITKRIVITGIAVIIAGVLVFSSAIATGVIGSAQYSQRMQALVKEETVALPDSFKTVNSIKFEKNGDPFYPVAEYIVDSGVPRYTLTSLPGEKVDVKIQDTKSVVTVSSEEKNQPLPYIVQTKLTIYGPALNELESKNLNVEYSASSQEKLSIIGEAYQRIRVSGTITDVDIKGKGEVDVSTSSITSLNVDNTKAGSVQAGTVRSLFVTQLDVCSDGYHESIEVSVRGVSSGVMTYNGTQRQATSISTACAKVTIGEVGEEE